MGKLKKLDYQTFVDDVETAISHMPIAEGELRTVVTKGLYGRSFKMPANTRWTSKIHKTEHQYVIVSGKGVILTEEGFLPVEAPFWGVTKVGTRRVLMIDEEMVFITFRPVESGVSNQEWEQLADSDKDKLIDMYEEITTDSRENAKILPLNERKKLCHLQL